MIAIIVGNSIFYAPIKRRRLARLEAARELEIKVRMAKGPEVVDDLRNLALLYKKARRFEEALSYYQQALQIGEQQFGTESPLLIPVLDDYAAVLKSMRRENEALKMKERSTKLSQAVK